MAEAVRSTIQLADDKGVVRHGGEWLVLWCDPDSIKTADERSLDRADAARRAACERYLAATLRSIAGRPELPVTFGGDRVEASPGGVTLPPLPARPDRRALDIARGLADAVAVRLRWHDAALHAPVAAIEPRRRMVVEALEQARCEALGIAELPGLYRNLTAALEDRLARLGLGRAHLASQIPLAEALRMVFRDALAGAERPSIATNGLEMWDRLVRREAGTELAALRQWLGDQAAFAEGALAVAEALARAMEWDGPRPAPRPGVPAECHREERPPPSPEAHRFGEARSPAEAGEPDGEPGALPAPVDAPDGAAAERTGGASTPSSPFRYRAFLTAHDAELPADALVPPATLAELRRKLDGALGDLRGVLSRLTDRLQRHLLAQQLRAWDFDQEEGLLDAARLDRVIVNPGSALSFKRERESPFADTVVTLLIDNSGSMRGRPITIAAMAADLVARALERCGVRCEVLGFTTRAWKGGRIQAAWAAAGRPEGPGRLNELLHIVYKPAAVPYRRARERLAAMLEPSLLKENVDGEALAWAHRRLLAMPQQRKVLLVVSDGAPADQATLQANPEDYLARHLQQVIGDIEATGRVELVAIGIGHDVGRFYRQAVRIDDAARLGPTLVAELSRLFGPRRRGPARGSAPRPSA
ncbi:MAG: cobaltochelatase subunit CobT [Geminicoccaceae bacterium]